MRERLEHRELELQQAHHEYAQLASKHTREDARKSELADASTQCDIERDVIESRQREALTELAQQVYGLSAAREELEVCHEYCIYILSAYAYAYAYAHAYVNFMISIIYMHNIYMINRDRCIYMYIYRIRKIPYASTCT
jgi:hypothetical protein